MVASTLTGSGFWYTACTSGPKCRRLKVGRRIHFSGPFYVRKKRAQADLDGNPVNSTLTAYFDSDKPTDAVLV